MEAHSGHLQVELAGAPRSTRRPLQGHGGCGDAEGPGTQRGRVGVLSLSGAPADASYFPAEVDGEEAVDDGVQACVEKAKEE